LAAILFTLEFFFPRTAEPGHSLISGRSAMPLLGFTVLQLSLSWWRKAMVFGCAIGCAFVFGTEHGISLTLALFALTGISLVQALLQRNFVGLIENVRFAGVAFLTAVATGALLLVAFCGPGGAANVLHFNLGELPADQFWFFGSPPMPYLTSLRQLIFDRHVLLCLFPSAFLVMVFAAITASRWRTPISIGRSDWRTLSGLMLIYGVLTAIPLIGILSRHYVFPQTRILLLVCLLALAHGLIRRLPQRTLQIAFLLFGVVSLTMLGYRSSQSAMELVKHRSQARASFDANLDDHWNSFMTGATHVIDSHRERPTLSLWSEYAALLDAHYNTFQPAEDYIIHAVGPERWPHYVRTFRSANPEFVTTMTSQFSFAEWLQDERWEFYEELLNNYHPLQQVEHDTIWQRNAGPWQEPSQTFVNVPLQEGKAVELPQQTPGTTMVVRVAYDVVNPWKKLPLIGGTPRFLATPGGTGRNMAISLPPYRHSFSFPVKQTGAGAASVQFRSEGFLPGAALRVTAVEVKTLTATAATAELFARRIIPSRY
jgi:hypothetical protein